MLLKHTFHNADVDRTLELFLRMILDSLHDELVSVVLHGSLVFNDLAPGYGDIDFVAIVQHDLSEEMCQWLIDLRRPLRSGQHGILAAMMEGAFLPQAMLDLAVHGRALWWGTSGERTWDNMKLGWLVLEVIRQRGIVIWGADIKPLIPAPRRQDLLDDIRAACKGIREHGRGGGLHSVDWLLSAARLLYWLKEGRLSSKSAAADWAFRCAEGGWRELLPRAKHLRLNPSEAESPEVQCWLEGLTEPIQDACRELDREMAKYDSASPNGQE